MCGSIPWARDSELHLGRKRVESYCACVRELLEGLWCDWLLQVPTLTLLLQQWTVVWTCEPQEALSPLSCFIT